MLGIISDRDAIQNDENFDNLLLSTFSTVVRLQQRAVQKQNMVRADQGIKGRAAPKTKSRSSVTSDIKARSTLAPPAAAAPPQHITKAAKRALKRSELMSQVKNNPLNGSSLLQLQPNNLSKSSLRRLKRKQKEQLAGNTDGMKDLEEAMDEVIDNEQDANLEDDEVFDQAYETESQHAPPSTALIGDKSAKRNGAVTEKARKKALTTEMARQNLILSDPAYTKSPFESLRLHAQNTLAFDQGAPRKKTSR